MGNIIFPCSCLSEDYSKENRISSSSFFVHCLLPFVNTLIENILNLNPFFFLQIMRIVFICIGLKPSLKLASHVMIICLRSILSFSCGGVFASHMLWKPQSLCLYSSLPSPDMSLSFKKPNISYLWCTGMTKFWISISSLYFQQSKNFLSATEHSQDCLKGLSSCKLQSFLKLKLYF